MQSSQEPRKQRGNLSTLPKIHSNRESRPKTFVLQRLMKIGFTGAPYRTLMKFRRRVGDLLNIPLAWQERLKEAKGIYLLTFPEGQQYVGSASGDQGFWQRWSDYARTGHGGNRILIRENLDARNADVSNLEVTGSSLTKQEIIEREMIWQTKLGSRAKGSLRNNLVTFLYASCSELWCSSTPHESREERC